MIRTWTFRNIALIGAIFVGAVPLGASALSFTVTDLGTLGGRESRAFGINDCGQVVGNSRPTRVGPQHAFFYDAALGGMLDLNDLIDPLSGWTLYDATGINNHGQITGFGGIGGEYTLSS